MRQYPIYTITDLANIARERQKNRFDFIIVWVGPRGSSKSTGNYKFCHKIGSYEIEFLGNKFDGGDFNPERDMVYSRKDLYELIKRRQFKVVDADELIRAGYNRSFQNSDQQELMTMLNMYRDNFNILGGCIPFFYDLDPDLRNMVFMRIDVIARGVGLIHIRNESLYTNDPWDTQYNKKIEEEWKKNKLKKRNYWELTTFRGIIYWGPLDPRSEAAYERIKRQKKEQAEQERDDKKNVNSKTDVYTNILSMAKEGKLTKDDFEKICLTNNLKYTRALDTLNKRLKDENAQTTFSKLLTDKKNTTSPNLPIQEGSRRDDDGFII